MSGVIWSAVRKAVIVMIVDIVVLKYGQTIIKIVMANSEMRPDDIPKHRHKFKAYTIEKNVRSGLKIQIVVCVFCGLRFMRDKRIKPNEVG